MPVPMLPPSEPDRQRFLELAQEIQQQAPPARKLRVVYIRVPKELRERKPHKVYRSPLPGWRGRRSFYLREAGKSDLHLKEFGPAGNRA